METHQLPPSFQGLDIHDPIASEISPGQNRSEEVSLGERSSNEFQPQFDEVWQGKTLDLPPTWSFPVPFVAYIPGGSSWSQIWGPPPRTLAELKMYKLSWAIRGKEEWHIKMKDPEIRERWKEHAVEQQERFPVDERVTSNMINYVIAELEGYANIADHGRGIQRGCFDAIWYSDGLICNELSDALKTAVAKLEDGEKDWHPGSDRQVLDLVHPSLYCVVYGRTRAFLPDCPRNESNFRVVGPPARGTGDLDWIQEFTLSQKFVWLPSDFAVGEDGSVRLVSPYINNLNPVLHRQLYPVIEDILAGFVPLFERVLGDSNTRDRVSTAGNGRIRTKRQSAIWPDKVGYAQRRTIPCIWGRHGIPRPEAIPAGVDSELFEDEFYTKAPKILPESHRAYKGALEKDFSPISLSGRTIQCIIKLANIHLTPEKPEYKGGSWHVEGMLNESIVASGIYYHDEANISESTLSFRVSTAAPAYHYQDDDICMEVLYGMERGDRCVQDLGSMITKQGRALAWPNLFQHRVSPFHLSDPTKDGHRKILAFFLVNPANDPIVSATDVPPQQADWIRQAFTDASPATGNFPSELYECVQEHLLSDSLMTRAEAEAYRLDLMRERTSFLVEHEKVVVQQPFDMCEH
ncbi:hypothetical protein FB451DRAFT_203127 [Mycena latifolia]|nr:hypothetical protein FB451DRAFT_203127 [Mycena latifolia]